MLLPHGEITADMKNAKPKKVATRSATAVDAYIGARIRQRRHDLEISQHALAKALGVTYQQIQKYEKRHKPRQRRAAVRNLQGFEGTTVIDVRTRSKGIGN